MPDMRKKIEEYITELNQEIMSSTAYLEDLVHSDSTDLETMTSVETRIQTLLDVVNDLQGRLAEVD